MRRQFLQGSTKLGFELRVGSQSQSLFLRVQLHPLHSYCLKPSRQIPDQFRPLRLRGFFVQLEQPVQFFDAGLQLCPQLPTLEPDALFDGTPFADELLRALGRRLGGGVDPSGTTGERVEKFLPEDEGVVRGGVTMRNRKANLHIVTRAWLCRTDCAPSFFPLPAL